MTLSVALGKRTTTDTVLHTLPVEVEGILNSKPLRYVFSDPTDPNPVTPDMLLMGRPYSSLPRAMYCSSQHGTIVRF